MLRARGVKTVILCGLVTHGCVDSTARHAYFNGYYDESFSLNTKAEQRAIEHNDYYEAGWRALQIARVLRLRHLQPVDQQDDETRS